ncbi:MAG: retron St85 family RNA-directed DNA polymerase [Pseudomonadota bacterium]
MTLPFSASELDMLIWSAPLRYKVYYIKKRRPGEYRQIAQPTPEIKLIQRWLVLNYFSKFPVHKVAKAYKYGTGLKDNVEPHINNRFLLKVDFQDFFPSINADHFESFMERHGERSEDIDVARNICFKRQQGTGLLNLAIGAPSSPLLSNIMLYTLDQEIQALAQANSVTYTRYADDLSFSCNEPGVLTRILSTLPEVISASSQVPLRLNSEKTVHASKKRGRVITGLVVTSDGKISVGQQRKRLLRAEIHHYKLGIMPAEDVEKLRGYLAYLNSVEPEHISRLKGSFGDEVIDSLFPLTS